MCDRTLSVEKRRDKRFPDADRLFALLAGAVISKTFGGVTSLKYDDEELTSAVDQPGAEPRRTGSVPSHLPQEPGVGGARQGSGTQVRGGRTGKERAGRLAVHARWTVACQRRSRTCIALCVAVWHAVHG